MSAVSRLEWERAEVERSAFEAAHNIDRNALISDEKEVARYLDPPAGTVYPLEYSFHLLGDVRGRTVLEYGCGDGVNTVVLARRGARVKALDISPELIDVARERFAVNRIDAGNVEFIVGSAHEVPLPDESVDVVFGMAILHHLDLEQSAREVRRVLRPGGRAIFQEPVRNSALLKFIRKLIPYRAPDVSPFERPLTDAELSNYAEGFSRFSSKAFTLPTTGALNLLPIVRDYEHAFIKFDNLALEIMPFLNYYAAVRVVELVK